MDVYQRRRLVAVLATVLVLVLIVVAIAGGGDDESTPIEPVDTSTPGVSEPLSKEEFIAEADDICEETAVAVANIDASDAKNQAEQELELTQSELDQLQSLTPPEEDQATLDDFFSALEELIDSLDKQFLAADRGDDTALTEAATEIDTAKSDVLEAAKDYGFKKCGEAGEPSAPPDTGTGGAAPTSTTPAAPATPAEPAAPAAPAAPAPAPAAPAGSGGGGGGGGGTGGGGSGGVGPG